MTVSKAVFSLSVCVLQQDSLGNQFSQLSLAPSEVPDHQTGVFSHSMVLQNQAPTGYVLQPGQHVSVPTYPPPTQSIQQQGYIQQPVQQMSACYCAPGQYPHSTQHYRPVTPVHYSGPQSQPLPPQQPVCGGDGGAGYINGDGEGGLHGGAGYIDNDGGWIAWWGRLHRQRWGVDCMVGQVTSTVMGDWMVGQVTSTAMGKVDCMVGQVTSTMMGGGLHGGAGYINSDGGLDGGAGYINTGGGEGGAGPMDSDLGVGVSSGWLEAGPCHCLRDRMILTVNRSLFPSLTPSF
ncbi:R3H domain-containing protein 1 isoform X5 [Tachysurus ichikawai]